MIAFSAIVFLFHISVGNCFPNGPPRSACTDGMPIHTKAGEIIPPQNSSCPYSITVNATSYRPGDTLSVRIHSYVNVMFKGLFLQVRPLPNNDNATFKNAPIGAYYRRIMNTKSIACVNSLDTLVHKDPFSKIESKMDWKSPLLMDHDVVVTATILKDFSTYWTNVESPRIKLIREDVLPAKHLKTPWVKEMIKTVKAKDDPEQRRKLVKERFSKGFTGTFDHNGYIMVHYINEMLPFEDRFEQDFQTKVANATLSRVRNTTSKSNLTSDEVVADAEASEDGFEVSPIRGQPSVEIPLGVEIKKGNSNTKSEYERLVKSLINGDYTDIDKLADMAEKRANR